MCTLLSATRPTRLSKNPGLKNVRGNLLQQAEKMPKCCAEEQKPGAFQRICPTFQKLFLKSDFFDSFNGLCCLRVDMSGLCPGAEKTRSQPALLSCSGSAARPGENA